MLSNASLLPPILRRVTLSPPTSPWTKLALRRLSTTGPELPLRWGPPAIGTKVHILLSGGVDSSVAGRLLLEQGYDLAPVYMRNWESLDEGNKESGGCEWEREWEDVQKICRESLGGVTPQLVDLSKQYWTDVFEPALEQWADGSTPNPDVVCNREIKFSALPSKLLGLDSTAWLATGHYARLLPSPLNQMEPSLHRGAYAPKDQSYYLSTSPISAFSRTMFPLGNLSKPQVRELARKWKLHTSEKKESMGICFIGTRRRFSEFLGSYIEPHPGNIEDASGRIVGRHNGLWRYTIGQKARLGGFPEKMFVAQKQVERNVVIVDVASSAMLQCVGVRTSDFKWISPSPPPGSVYSPDGLKVCAQTRSLQPGSTAECTVRGTLGQSSLSIAFDKPLLGVSPGQAVVLYDKSWCLGGGTIQQTITLADNLVTVPGLPTC